MIYQKRTTFRFDCPECTLELEVTHLYWSKIVCLFCEKEIDKIDMELKNG